MTNLKQTRPEAYPVLLTPFSGGAIELHALGIAVDRQVAGGMNGIVVCDVIREGHSLTQAERDAVLRTCISRSAPALSVVASAGANCTRTSVEQCRRAEELGADDLLVPVPYYSKPTLEGIVEHFEQIGSSVIKPIIVDDDPARMAKD